MERLRHVFSRPPREPIRVVLYSRPGCHLCEEARALLERIAGPGAIVIEEIDIRSDPELVRAYDLLIPVLQIGEARLSAPITENELRRALIVARRS